MSTHTDPGDEQPNEDRRARIIKELQQAALDALALNVNARQHAQISRFLNTQYQLWRYGTRTGASPFPFHSPWTHDAPHGTYCLN